MLLRTPSLAREFSIFFMVVVAGMVFLASWFSWRTYSTQRSYIEHGLQAQSEHLADTMEDIVRYAEHLMGYIAKQISDQSTNGDDLEVVYQALASHRVIEKDVLSWNPFTWVDCFHNVTVSGRDGILTVPYKSVAKRDYIPRTVTEPGRIHLGRPVFGTLSNLWQIPCGYGVNNKHGRYIGAIATGLVIEWLEKKLESVISINGVSFYLLDNSFKIAAHSPNHRNGLPEVLVQRLSQINTNEQSSGMLSRSALFGTDLGYFYYRSMPEYGYHFIVSYDKHLSNALIWRAIFDYVLQFLVIGSLIIVLLLIFRQRIIHPISRLAQSAVAISRGENDITIPEYASYEIDSLAVQLRHVIGYTQELRDAKESLTKSNELVKSALGYMAHELKTPLNLMAGFSEMMLHGLFGELEGKNKEYIKLIYDAAQHQHKLINSFLSTAEYEDGVIVLDRSCVDLRKMLNAHVAMVSSLAREMDVTVSIDYPESEIMLYADEMRLGQALLNIMTNGIKYNKRQGLLNVVVVYDETANTLSLRYHDTGIGIASTDYDVIFERFARIKRTTEREVEGHGLGLAFSKEIIELHEGRVHIDSKLGRGTTFTITLPLGTQQ
jgi:signal transduction histidine kinase